MSTRPLVIVGDVMLDIDLEGSATRLSPEAPVPVVDTERVWHRPGGAGLAALLAARHEDNVALVTGICDDASGRRLRELLGNNGVRIVDMPMTGSTITKTRVRARGQSVLRIDHGDGLPVAGPLPEPAADVLAAARGVCVADYGGGLTKLRSLRDALMSAAGQAPVVWDPHPRGSAPVPGCRLVTPNDDEARHLCGNSGSVDGLRGAWQADAVCVTLGARGAQVFVGQADCCHVGVPQIAAAGSARTDVCGAGDRFAVAATVALADGADPRAAVVAAVEAAARFVAAGGAAAVSTPTLGADIGLDTTRSENGLGVDVVELARRLQASGRTVVATGGCFDLLHTGHVRLLRQARQFGDALIVLINSDRSVRELKGDGRPVVSEGDRARVLAALACVDAVAVFDEPTPERLLADLKPDIWVKGGDYTLAELPEAQVVQSKGGEVFIVPTVAGYSSSRLIAAARSDHDQP
jgi:rfaE bifunctional protein nucleotidyltransferase chain/domain/rfaE bifunctional protein kinase chain/domain